MKPDYLNNNHPNNKRDIISVGLLGVSAFMGVLILIKITAFFAAPARAENSVKRAVSLSKPNAEEVEKHLAKSKVIADELKKKNLFAPPPPKQHPVKQVSGILGDEVLINGKWYKAGDKVGDAIIVAVEPTQVRIEWQGSKKGFAPISAVSAPEPKKVVAKAVVKKERPKKVEKAAEEKAETVSAEDPLAWMGVDLPPKAREMILQQWNKASDEEKAKAKEEWNNMPEDQKQQAVEAMQQMPDSISVEIEDM
ncbi:MAG: hypothetical protein ACYTDW_05550 [Planctomycetota bacterium]|jgi:hypothetical protein